MIKREYRKKNNDGIQIIRRPEKRKNKECIFDEKRSKENDKKRDIEKTENK